MSNSFTETISNQLYKFLFHWNSFTKEWRCFPSGSKREYFNGDYKTEVGIGSTPELAYANWCNKQQRTEQCEHCNDWFNIKGIKHLIAHKDARETYYYTTCSGCYSKYHTDNE